MESPVSFLSYWYALTSYTRYLMMLTLNNTNTSSWVFGNYKGVGREREGDIMENEEVPWWLELIMHRSNEKSKNKNSSNS